MTSKSWKKKAFKSKIPQALILYVVLYIYCVIGGVMFFYIETCMNTYDDTDANHQIREICKELPIHENLGGQDHLTTQKTQTAKQSLTTERQIAPEPHTTPKTSGKPQEINKQQKSTPKQENIDSWQQIVEICRHHNATQESSHPHVKCKYSFEGIMMWIMFTWETVTTVGYGEIVPKSTAGKLLIIPYSMGGIVLCFVCLRVSGWALR